MKNQQIEFTSQHKVKCEGQASDGTGHPRIFLEIKDEHITCPYCSKIFKLKK